MGTQTVRNQYHESIHYIIEVTVDIETAEMIKRRYGEAFATALAPSLEIKSSEAARRDAKGKRKPRINNNRGDKPERKPREPR